jgi:hypothetical protein
VSEPDGWWAQQNPNCKKEDELSGLLFRPTNFASLQFEIEIGTTTRPCHLQSGHEGQGRFQRDCPELDWKVRLECGEDHGKIHGDPFKSQQLKEPKADAPPARIAIAQGEFSIFREHVDFGIFDDDNDVPDSLDPIINLDDDDDDNSDERSICGMPALPPRIEDLDDEERIDSMDCAPAEDEDALSGVDDHVIHDNLEDLDECGATLEACPARTKVRVIGNLNKVEHKKSKTTWEQTTAKDNIPEKHAIEQFQQVGLRGFDFENLSESPALDVFFELWPGDCKEHLWNLNHWVPVINADFCDQRKKIKEVPRCEFHGFLAVLL